MNDIQELANLTQQWKVEVKEYFIYEFPFQVIIGLGVVMLLMYITATYSGLGPPLKNFHWSVSALIIWTCLQIPAVMAFIPKRPTQQDVDANRALRKAFGMDNRVKPPSQGRG